MRSRSELGSGTQASQRAVTASGININVLLPTPRGEGGRRPDEGSAFALGSAPSSALRAPSPPRGGGEGSGVVAAMPISIAIDIRNHSELRRDSTICANPIRDEMWMAKKTR